MARTQVAKTKKPDKQDPKAKKPAAGAVATATAAGPAKDAPKKVEPKKDANGVNGKPKTELDKKATATGSSSFARRPWPTRSRRWASVAPMYPGHSATVLVTLAVTADIPPATSAGNVMRLPPPAIALTPPPTSAAPAASTNLGSSVIRRT